MERSFFDHVLASLLLYDRISYKTPLIAEPIFSTCEGTRCLAHSEGVFRLKAYFYRLRFVISVILAAVLPILVTGFVLLKAAEQALLDEKRQKLIAITEQMDFALTQSYEQILAQLGSGAETREEQIKLLNSFLEPLTNQIAAAHPGVGVGYYAASLDAILTYGPSEESLHVGKAISADHPGREVMASGRPAVVIGQQVRGNIMNAMLPLIRDGQVIGYVWANELVSNIDEQLAGMRQSISIILGIGCVLAAAVSGLVVHRLEIILADIQAGLAALRFNLSHRMKPLKGEAGEISEAINRLARDLQASRSHTETIMDSMDNGVIALDQGGRLTAWNEAAARLLELSGEEARGEAYTQVFARSPELIRLITETLQHAQTIRDAQWEHAHTQRGMLSLKVSTSIWRSPTEEMLGVIVVVEDRTEWKQMEANLAQAQRLAVIGEWAASIAHEVRNPLTSIKAFAQIIEEELPPEHENREYTRIIMEEVERLNRFAEELLLFSRPSRESNVPVDLNAVLGHTWKLIAPHAAQRGVALQLKTAEELPQVLASPELLKHVFLNILLNAVQAAPAGGKVTLETDWDDDRLRIHVTNDGPAIEEEHLVSVFEPFFTTKHTGTGLGLAISQRIVQAYGGHIVAENVSRGVRFTVVLPVNHEEVEG